MDAYKNFAYSLVQTAPSPATSGTSLTVTGGTGGAFPAVPFNATVWPANVQPLASNAEIVRVTARSTDTLTITRAQESTTARSIQVGDQIAATFTAKLVDDVSYQWIATASPAATTVTFSSIPQTYKHLRILWRAANNGTTEQALFMTFNGDAAANYDYSYNEVNNGTALAGRSAAANALLAGIVGTSSGALYSGEVVTPDYAGTGVLAKNAWGTYAGVATTARIGIAGGRWNSTAAITSIGLSAGGGAFLSGSRFDLYGIRA